MHAAASVANDRTTLAETLASFARAAPPAGARRRSPTAGRALLDAGQTGQARDSFNGSVHGLPWDRGGGRLPRPVSPVAGLPALC